MKTHDGIFVVRLDPSSNAFSEYKERIAEACEENPNAAAKIKERTEYIAAVQQFGHTDGAEKILGLQPSVLLHGMTGEGGIALDGTYGMEVPYIYWWDVRGIYHQHFVSGGQIIHISDQPVVVKSIIINMELRAGEK